MTEFPEDAEVSWYDISIAGRQFNIASRRGEAHIRNVERLIEETIADLSDRVQGQNPLNLALLTALNLADRLLSLESDLNSGAGKWQEQLERMLNRLGQVVPDGYRSLDPVEKESTSAVFD